MRRITLEAYVWTTVLTRIATQREWVEAVRSFSIRLNNEESVARQILRPVLLDDDLTE